MRRLLATIILLTAVCAARADVFDDALAKAGQSKQTARFDALDLAIYGGDAFKLPYFDVYHRDPYRTPERIKLFRETVGRSAAKTFDCINLSSSLLDATIRRSLLGDPSAEFAKKSEGNDALETAVLGLWKAVGKAPPIGYEKRLRRDAASVPTDLAKNAAMLLFAEADAVKWRNHAFARLSASHKLDDLYRYACTSEEKDYDPLQEEMIRDTDLKLLLTGAENLAAAVDRATQSFEKIGVVGSFRFEAETPLGKVVLSGDGDDTYPAGVAFALIIDCGGNDTYLSGASNVSAANCATVLIDVSGDDKYLESPDLARTEVQDFPARKGWKSRPNTCAAAMGYAFLVDLSGSDRYESINNAQAYAAYGVAILRDRSGDDIYNCYQGGQGSATVGIAVLSDLKGNDKYRCYTTSQGFGSTRGLGMLVDSAGNDSYLADNANIEFPSAQDPKHNGNLAQGMGCGLRADYTNGHSLAGGIGALVDLAGNDTYVSDIMAQGMGYWFGLGILADGAGNDSYTGYWYNQGSAAHFAVGILDDAAGNDIYIAPCSMVQGAGHDYSLGSLLDEGGGDCYTSAGISLGAGNANGIGIFWDKSGDDVYNASGNFTLGRANIASRGSMRDYDLCMGLFLDTGGSDKYPDTYPFAKNNAGWTQAGSDTVHPVPTEVGIGLDTDQVK